MDEIDLLLLNYDYARFNLGTNHDGETPLHVASEKNMTDEIVFLLENGADIHAKNSMGETPLHKASNGCSRSSADVLCRCMESIRLLLANGAILEEKDNGGATALHKAFSNGYYECEPHFISVLLENGASLEAENNNGETPLHVASSCWAVGTFRQYHLGGIGCVCCER